MARRAKPAKSAAKTAVSPETGPEERLIEAALALAARQGWRNTGLGDIAREAGLPLHEAYAVARSKPALLAAWHRRIDRAALDGAAEELDEPPRDRLFDLLMRRFDALQPHRVALRTILRDSIGDPAALLAAPALLQSMAWMLEAAGISAAGWRGRVRVQLLAGLYLLVLRAFLQDESADLTRTMAVLDQRLRRAESWLGLSRAPGNQGTEPSP
jgi:AcrR family transcriptional regulator